MKYDRETYLEMLSYMRPAYSKYNKKFCRRYIQPVFGLPDQFGNYIKIIGDKPKVAFMAHHDTVHHKSGRAEVKVIKDHVGCTTQNCLGADDTTGCFIILSMINANVPGVYVIHAAEEIGCVGSSRLVAKKHAFFNHVDFAISLDRKGCTSIITHQVYGRTCSDAFADSLNDVLGGGFVKDTGGVYTDSNEYVSVIGECTNLSVGYYNMHSNREYQDLDFMEQLIQRMINADWSKLVKSRSAGEQGEDPLEYRYGQGYYDRFIDYVSPTAKDYERGSNSYPVGGFNSSFKGSPKYSARQSAKTFLMDEYGDSENDYYDESFGRNGYVFDQPKDEVSQSLEVADMVQIIDKYKEEVAQILLSYGYSPSGLIDDCDDLAVKNNRSYGRIMNF
jgi:hypothetical protein